MAKAKLIFLVSLKSSKDLKFSPEIFVEAQQVIRESQVLRLDAESCNGLLVISFTPTKEPCSSNTLARRDLEFHTAYHNVSKGRNKHSPFARSGIVSVEFESYIASGTTSNFRMLGSADVSPLVG